MLSSLRIEERFVGGILHQHGFLTSENLSNIVAVSARSVMADESGAHLLRLELGDGVIADNVSNVYGAATNFAVFDVALAPYGNVEHHRNLFAAIGASEELFHSRGVVLTYQRGSCKQSRQQEEHS
jgi:hypothetical protein